MMPRFRIRTLMLAVLVIAAAVNLVIQHNQPEWVQIRPEVWAHVPSDDRFLSVVVLVVAVGAAICSYYLNKHSK